MKTEYELKRELKMLKEMLRVTEEQIAEMVEQRNMIDMQIPLIKTLKAEISKDVEKKESEIKVHKK